MNEFESGGYNLFFHQIVFIHYYVNITDYILDDF